MERTPYQVTVKLDSYIAEPYLPATDDLINILKKSGASRARSDAKREAALKAYLNANGISAEAYAALQKKAAEKWYKNDQGTIIIPRHQFCGCVVTAVGQAPAAVRGQFDKDSFRHYVRVSDFVTDR